MAESRKKYGMLIDLNRCVGCYACQVTCKTEYNIPFGISRCRVETYQSGKYPDIKKFFLPRLCNQCEKAPCIEACEENALYRSNDGIVILDNKTCTNCRKCFEKCPYNAIEVSLHNGQAEKCDFCYEKITKGSLPVCVQSCMGKAFVFGDLNETKSEISAAIAKNKLKVLNPEFGTDPLVFYVYEGNTSGSPLKSYEINREQSTTGISEGQIFVSTSEKSEKTKLVHTSDAMCPSECGIKVLVENGIAKKIYGNPHSLINNGTLCAKGASGLKLTYSRDRIKAPLLRTGQRGEDKWKEITWDEAVNYIVKKLIKIKDEFGPESVFLDCGDVTDREAYYRVFHAFGTPNTFNHGSICDSNRKWGQFIMTGDERPLPDVQRPVLVRNSAGEAVLKTRHDAGLIMNIGVNPFVATRFNYMSGGIPAAKQSGCIYIVVDPAFTNSAAHADMWLPIIPGADAALLASMLYYIIENDSSENPSRRFIDHEFIKKYTEGWSEFKNSFLSYTKKKDPANNLFFFTPEWAEEKTGIPEGNIKKAAHLFGSTKPASIEIGMHGTSHHTNGDVTSILMTALCLVTGNMDNPGGLVFIDSQKAKKGIKTSGRDFLKKTASRKIDGKSARGELFGLNKDSYGDYPASWKGVLADLPKKIREGVKLKHGHFKGYSYPVKAFITRAGNPVITAGSTPDWIDAVTLKKKTNESSVSQKGENNPPLPPFDKGGEGGLSDEYRLELMVFIDTHISVTGRYADIVLPEAGFLERMGLSDVYTMSPEVALRDRVIEPLYESKTPFEIMSVLADAFIKNGDKDVKIEDFKKKYRDEEDFINEMLIETPGFYNIGKPLPYPDLPEGALITGTPDNPTAILDEATNPPSPPFIKGGQGGFSGKKVIKQGERLTVNWLRKHNGVAVWPASYYRYKKSDGSLSGIYPKTGSKKFEFKFKYLENINKKFGTDFPLTFYWSENRWNPKNPSFKDLKKEYPFQLISGRVHYAMTMTSGCHNIAETETECMQKLNNDFKYSMPGPGDGPDKEITFKANSVAIPVFAFNSSDGRRLGIQTGNIVTLENPLKKIIKGKVFLTEEIMPGVIKTAFGPGGQKASGIGFMNKVSDYTPNINELFDPENLSPFTGMPGFGDIMVKVIKGSDK